MLSYDDVMQIHYALVELFRNEDPINPPGERPGQLVKSAVDRQMVGANGTLKYPTPTENAATLAYGLCCNHGFHNGNKRTALVSMLVHLDRNNLVFDAGVNPEDVYSLILGMAKHELHMMEIARLPARRSRQKRVRQRKLRDAKPFSADEAVEYTSRWIAERIRPIKKGELLITFRQLNDILKSYGYEITQPDRNTSSIVRLRTVQRTVFLGMIRKAEPAGKSVGTITCPGMNREVGLSAIKEVRRLCELTETDGVDSTAFYNKRSPVDYFLNRYRNILKRLAHK